MSVDVSESQTAVTAAELIARAHALVPTLQARQAQTERERRVSAESIRDLIDAGLFRALRPKRYGGLETDFETFFHIAAEIGSGCGATGWVYAVVSSQLWVTGLFSAAAQDDVWATTPDALVTGSARPAGSAVVEDGGYRVNGMWTFCSGCDNVQWVKVGVAVLPQKSAPASHQALVLIPRDQVEIDDQWDVVGLAGTGSKNIIVEDVFVPAHRMLTMAQATSGNAPGAQINDGILFRIPIFAALSIALCAPAIGMAMGILDDFTAASISRSTVGGIEKRPKRMAELPAIQLRVAEAACAIDAAKLLVLRDCREIMAAAVSAGDLTTRARARNKADLAYATQLVLAAVDRLFKSGGGHGLFRSNRIQQAWRDLTGAAMHISLNWDASGTNYGRALLELPPEGSQF
jgi:resorcinol 4-hydroxylase (FADH2)